MADFDHKSIKILARSKVAPFLCRHLVDIAALLRPPNDWDDDGLKERKVVNMVTTIILRNVVNRNHNVRHSIFSIVLEVCGRHISQVKSQFRSVLRELTTHDEVGIR